MNVLLVDDESIIRQGIKTFVPWSDLGCVLAGEAENGRKALEFMETNDVDIVITDIRMPQMDGLELSREIQMKHPLCRVIILTGYEDFEYARQALHYKVSEYLLKPVGDDELTEVLKKTIASISGERKRINEENRMRSLLSQSKNSIVGKLVKNLIEGNVSDHMMNKHSEELQLSIDWASSLQVIILFSENGFDAVEVPEGSLAVDHIVDGRKARLLLYSCGSKKDFFWRDLNHSSLTAAVGSKIQGMENIYLSYGEALEASRYIPYLSAPAIIHFGEKERFRERFLRSLPDSLSYGDVEKKVLEMIRSFEPGAQDLISPLLHWILQEKGDRREFIRLSRRLFNATRKEAERIGIGASDGVSDFFSHVSPDESWHSISGKVIEIFRSFCESVISAREHKYSALTNRIISYIEKHFIEDISLNDIAEMTGVSQSHISRVFKKDTAMNFVPWVNRYRVEYSKELLVRGDLKLYDIADLSGFNNYKYYVTQFKKFMGITPSDFRNNYFDRLKDQK